MKTLRLLTALLLSTCGLYAQTETRAWTRLIGGPHYDFGLAVAVDPSGNAIISGATRNSLSGELAGRFDFFVAKYDATGKQLWLAQRGSEQREFGDGVATDASGNVYVAGYTGPNSAMDGNKKGGRFDIILMKYDPSGKWLWTRQDGGSQDDMAHAVATDRAGNVYITGYARGNFHGLPKVGAADVFISKYDPSGKRLWSALFGSPAVDEGMGITCDAAGNVFVTGYAQGPIETNKYFGQGDNFLAKYDTSGKRLWLKQWGTGGKDTGYSVATDAAGNAYVSGYTTRDLYHAPFGQRDGFLAKYDPQGNPVWGRQFGTAEHDQAWGVATDASGNVFVAGEAGGSLDKNPHAGGLDVFLTKYDAKGDRLATYQYGTPTGDAAKGVAVAKDGAIYLAGWTAGNLDGNTIHAAAKPAAASGTSQPTKEKEADEPPDKSMVSGQATARADAFLTRFNPGKASASKAVSQ